MNAVRQDPIIVLPYDPTWPASYERQREPVAAALRPWLLGPVEHIGSTAVPGLPAKPIIDMLARIPDYDAGRPIVAALEAIGWVHAPEPDDERNRTWEFCFPTVARRTHHLHLVEARSADWRTWLAFRDHLRTHPMDAAEYARLKRELATADQHDRPAYRAGKAPFIRAIIQRIAPPTT